MLNYSYLFWGPPFAGTRTRCIKLTRLAIVDVF